MIKCPKCSEENQMGAIFCRSCGDKLELDDLRPDDFGNQEGDASAVKTAIAFIRNLLILTLIVGVIAGIILAFLTPAYATLPQLDDDQSKVAKGKFIKFRKGKTGTEVSFSVAEINMLAKLVLDLTDEAKGKARETRLAEEQNPAIVYDDLVIELMPPTDVRLIIRLLLYDKVPMIVTLTGPASASADGLTFEPRHVMIGKLPVPMPQLQAPLVDNVAKLTRDNQNFQDEIQSKIKTLVMNGDGATIAK